MDDTKPVSITETIAEDAAIIGAEAKADVTKVAEKVESVFAVSVADIEGKQGSVLSHVFGAEHAAHGWLDIMEADIAKFDEVLKNRFMHLVGKIRDTL